MTLIDPNERHHSENPAEGADHGMTPEPTHAQPRWPEPEQRDRGDVEQVPEEEEDLDEAEEDEEGMADDAPTDD